MDVDITVINTGSFLNIKNAIPLNEKGTLK